MAAASGIYYSILSSLLAAAAFILCWAAEFGCSYISFTSTSGYARPVTVKFGIWSYQFWTIATSVGGSVAFETCHKYPSYVDIDSHWKAARAFSTLALIFGGVFLFANLISACLSPLRKTSRLEAPAFLMACFFQGMSLLLLHSAICTNNDLVKDLQKGAAELGTPDLVFPETCSLSTGANCTIAAIVLWAAAALSSFNSLRLQKKEEAQLDAAIEPLIPGENL